ncbi:hypothetical protein [Nonomuraea sp. NPDC049758]|uniref:hypothetical protein n=1 Tax=Nonomuraea sp. NPDC049758 TaxID=3154360 RepID=UPI00341D04D1
MTIQETPPEQIPAVITVREVPAAAEARDALLKAITAQATAIADGHQGQASTALEELARAYALVTSGATAVVPTGETTTLPLLQSRAGGHQVGLCLELEP